MIRVGLVRQTYYIKLNKHKKKELNHKGGYERLFLTMMLTKKVTHSRAKQARIRTFVFLSMKKLNHDYLRPNISGIDIILPHTSEELK